MSFDPTSHRELDTVLVTGGSRGIGRAAVEAFAAAGARVHTCATSADALAEVGAGSDRIVTHVVDVTEPDEVASMADAIRESDGTLDCLINNAAVLGPRARLEDVSLDAWRRTIDVNVHGTFIVSTACLELLAPGGIVINMSSSVGRRGRGEWGPYAVSKFGVEALTDVLADELRERDVAVVSLNPGGTATDMRAEAYPDENPDILPGPEDVARTVLLLASCLDVGQTKGRYSSRDLFGFASLLE